MKKAVFLLLLLIPCFVCCTGTGTAALVGKWVTEEGQKFWVDSIEFFKDGSALVNGEGTSWESTENGYLKIPRLEAFGLGTDGFPYIISGSILTITYFGHEYRLQKTR